MADRPVVPSTASAPQAVRVLVIDDHQILLESLVRLLDGHPAITVVGSATTGTDGLALADELNPAVVVVDYALPDLDGAEITAVLKARDRAARVIVLTGSERPGAYYAAIEAGADAWMRKTSAAGELVDAVLAVAAGRPVLDQERSMMPRTEDLVVHYQPVVRLPDRAIVGFEALVRWADPARGIVGPGEFLPQAEQSGFILDIGRKVLLEATAQLQAWHERYPTAEPRWMAANLSGTGLMRPTLQAEVQGILEQVGLAPPSLVIEVTETVLLADSDEAVRQLASLRELGVRLALDDFGTAFSSLSYLRRFEFDHIKMDTSFTAELPHGVRSKLVMESVQQIASTFQMHCIAEGVEREDQERYLVDAGWTLAQGFRYARPAPAADIEAILERT